jgi:hypothetical protein
MDSVPFGRAMALASSPALTNSFKAFPLRQLTHHFFSIFIPSFIIPANLSSASYSFLFLGWSSS